MKGSKPENSMDTTLLGIGELLPLRAYLGELAVHSIDFQSDWATSKDIPLIPQSEEGSKGISSNRNEKLKG